jgi:hypothetical protein
MEIPNAVTFLLATPAYAAVEFAEDEVWNVLEVLFYAGTYDSYCTKCQRESTFQMLQRERPQQYTRNLNKERLERQNGITPHPPRLEPGVYHLQASCTRVNRHKQDFFFLAETEAIPAEKGIRLRSTVQKIGQQPSYGDLHILQVKKYTHVLSQAQLGELTRAIGLASHDVGVGAYVYLRRIFEALVEESHQLALKDTGWDEVQFQRSRMAERIGLLKSHLPTFLVEHAGMYSLLSKGIHELSEQECLKHFDTLRLGIELVLDERVEERQRVQKMATARAAIQKAVGDAKT